MDLGLTSVCEYVRPLWWDNPAEREEKKEKINTLIGEHKNASLSGKVSLLSTFNQASHNDLGEAAMRTKPTPFPSINQGQRSTISSLSKHLPTRLNKRFANRNPPNTKKVLGENNDRLSPRIIPRQIHRRKRLREVDEVGEPLQVETPLVTKRVHKNHRSGSDDDSQESSPHTTDSEDGMTRF